MRGPFNASSKPRVKSPFSREKQERVELQTEDQVSAELQDTIFLGGDALPPVSDNERCSQVAPEVIRIQLKISLYDDVIVATYRI